MIGWEEARSNWRLNLLLFVLLAVAAAGFFAGWYAGTHRCPQEDSCSYSNHQWQPEEH